MGHTNQTANYNLPQFVGTDKPSWLGDINDAFAAIDTAIAAAASEASTADGKADALTTTVSGHTTQIGVLNNTVTTQGNTLNTVTSLIGNGTPTTTDQTIIGAINELHADQGDLEDLQTTDKSSLVAAINEAAQGGGGGGHVVVATVTADGSKTWTQLLNELYALISSENLENTVIEYFDTTNTEFYQISYYSNAIIIASYAYVTSSDFEMNTIQLLTSGSKFYRAARAANTDRSSQTPASGSTLKLVRF